MLSLRIVEASYFHPQCQSKMGTSNNLNNNGLKVNNLNNKENKGCFKVPRSANILGAVSDPLFITPSTRFIDKIRFTSYELHLMGHGPLLLDRSVCLLLIAMWPSFGYFSMFCDIIVLYFIHLSFSR